jgi:hypothetical protein
VLSTGTGPSSALCSSTVHGGGKRPGMGGCSTRWGVTPADILLCEALSVCGDSEPQLHMNNSQRAQLSDRYAKGGPGTSAIYQKRVGAIHQRRSKKSTTVGAFKAADSVGLFSMPRLRATSIVEPDTSRRIYQRHGYIKQIKPAVGERACFRSGASAQA